MAPISRSARLALALSLAIPLAGLLAAVARADLVHLNTGGVVKGEIISETDDEVQIRTAAGITTVFREDIERIERGTSAESAYEDGLKKLAKDDADGHYRLGLYLRKIRLEKQARDCFERAIKIDPNHLPARIALREGTARDEVLVAAAEELSGSADPASAAVRRKLAPDAQRALDRIRRELKSHAAEARAQAIERLVGLHEGAASQDEKDAIRAAAQSFEGAARKAYDRNVRALTSAIPDYERPAERRARDRFREAWEKARDEALKVIFDLTIYPDENHGRAGQPVVDEKVEEVRKVYPAYDQLVAHDLSRFTALAEDGARTFAAALERSRALVGELRGALERMGAQDLAPLPPEAPAGPRAVLLYRAGRIADAWALKDSLSAWEARLLERLRDLRVEAHNDRMLSEKAAPEKGKRPNGEERHQVAITNQYRMLMGRAALEIHPCLVESARGHSQEMTQLGYFAHESPVERNRTPSDRARNAGYEQGVAENISMGSQTAQATHDAWYNSSGHHRNILGSGHMAMGSGLDGQHWTQNFGPAGLLER